jgi:hypothetical protein
MELMMRPKPPVRDVPDDLFRQRLTSIIDARHPLIKTADLSEQTEPLHTADLRCQTPFT